nr:MAG TPA_asm: hypothetical protein [Caudoviricetes sp.]
MKRYTDVHGSQIERPPEIDAQSSPTTVYVRENIRREGEFWVYDETQYTTREYIQKQAADIALLQQVSAVMIQAASSTTLSVRSAQSENFETLATRFLQER